jgi:hypothetical protein
MVSKRIAAAFVCKGGKHVSKVTRGNAKDLVKQGVLKGARMATPETLQDVIAMQLGTDPGDVHPVRRQDRVGTVLAPNRILPVVTANWRFLV